MKRHFGSLLAGVILFTAAGAAAQQPQPAPPTPFRGTAAVARQTTPPASPAPAQPASGTFGAGQVRPAPTAAAAADPSAGGQVINIRLEVSVSDQAGPQPAQPKLLTLLLADRS